MRSLVSSWSVLGGCRGHGPRLARRNDRHLARLPAPPLHPGWVPRLGGGAEPALPGKPWSWCLEFPDAFTERCAAPALLGKGFHHAHIAVGNTFGCPAAVKQFNAFYEALTARGLAKKTGADRPQSRRPLRLPLGRGNPDKVAVIYGDAPVCDFKSWPGGKGKGKGSPGDWAALLEMLRVQGRGRGAGLRGNPVDTLEPLARARVALVHVVGDADESCPRMRTPPSSRALPQAGRADPGNPQTRGGPPSAWAGGSGARSWSSSLITLPPKPQTGLPSSRPSPLKATLVVLPFDRLLWKPRLCREPPDHLLVGLLGLGRYDTTVGEMVGCSRSWSGFWVLVVRRHPHRPVRDLQTKARQWRRVFGLETRAST